MKISYPLIIFLSGCVVISGGVDWALIESQDCYRKPNAEAGAADSSSATAENDTGLRFNLKPSLYPYHQLSKPAARIVVCGKKPSKHRKDTNSHHLREPFGFCILKTPGPIIFFFFLETWARELMQLGDSHDFRVRVDSGDMNDFWTYLCT